MQNNKFHGLIFQVYDDSSIFGPPFWRKKSHRRQAGGHRIATFLRSHGWDIEVIDFAASFTAEELQEIVKSRTTKETRFFGFSCIFGSWPAHINEFANVIKSVYPDIPIIYGGTDWPKSETKAIDYYITGYGEHAVLKLLKYICGNADRSSLQFDQRYHDKNVIFANKTDPAFPLNVLSIDYQTRDFLLPEEWLNIELSRGCIFKCSFCNYPLLNVKGNNTQDEEDFYRSMQKNYDNFGIKNYYVVDDTFNDYPEKVKRFADTVERLSFVPFYSGFVRADLLIKNPSVKEDLVRMNFLGHLYGVETFNYRSLQKIGKTIQPELLMQGLIDIKHYFLNTRRKIYRGSLSFIVGLPEDTIPSMLSTVKWCKDNWDDQHAVWAPLFIPNTEKEWANSPSSISKDINKFGYIKNNISTNAGEISWQNEHITQQHAETFVEKLVPSLVGGIANNISSLTLDELTYPGRSIDKGLSEPYLYDYKIESQQFRESIVNRYKVSKLSL